MSYSQSTEFLGKEKISKLMLKFCIPCVLSLLISALYNIVDQIFIGNSELSTLGNAATGVVFPIFIIAQGVAWYFGDGSAAYINIHQGKGDTDKIHICVGTGMTLICILSVFLPAVFYPLKTQVLSLFGASENTIGYAIEYFNIILGFFPVYMLSNMINAVVRADGSPSWSMFSMLAGAIINIILDPVFIFACKWGMAGAAWATAIGQIVSFVISIAYLFRTKTFKLTIRSFVPRLKIYGEAFKLGISSLITQMTIVVISLVCNMMLAKYGATSKYGVDIPIAVIGIESKVFTVVINIVVGIVLGCQPIIGYNIGAKNFDRVKKLYRSILLCTVCVGVIIIVRDRPRCGRRHVRQTYKYTEPRRLLGIFRKNIPHISRPRNVYLHYQNVVHLLPGSRKTRIRSFNVIDKGYFLLYSAHMHAARFFRDRRYFDRRARCRFHCNDSYRNNDAFLFR